MLKLPCSKRRQQNGNWPSLARHSTAGVCSLQGCRILACRLKFHINANASVTVASYRIHLQGCRPPSLMYSNLFRIGLFLRFI